MNDFIQWLQQMPMEMDDFMWSPEFYLICMVSILVSLLFVGCCLMKET